MNWRRYGACLPKRGRKPRAVGWTTTQIFSFSAHGATAPRVPRTPQHGSGRKALSRFYPYHKTSGDFKWKLF